MVEEVLTWNLDDIVTQEGFNPLYVDVEERVGQLDGYYEKLDPDMDEGTFKGVMEFNEGLKRDLSRLEHLAELMLRTDRTSETARLLKDKVKNLEVKYKDAFVKTDLWIQGKELKSKPVLDEENAKRLFRSVPSLEYVLTYKRESAKYSLTEGEEKIISKKDAVVSAFDDIRSSLVTDFRFFFKPEGVKRGRTIDTESRLISNFFSEDPDKREAASIALMEKYKSNLRILFMIYQAVVKDWDYEAEIRGYKSPISVRNHDNHVPDEAIATLLDVCSENNKVFQRYFKWKARELRMKKLRRCDIYAPIKTKEGRVIPFTEAADMVFETLGNFCTGFEERARQIFDSGHVDSHPRKGKDPGAFCATAAPDIVPYLFSNYSGKPEEIRIISHELGHGIHSQYANHLPMSSFHANIPLSETASTFSEMVVFKRLLEEAESDEVRKSLLSSKMSILYKSIPRQNGFVIFEMRAHDAIKKGVTAEELSDIYFETLQEQFGDSVEINPLFRYEWAFIPHIVRTPFYCYAYDFHLLSLALFSKYEKQGKDFIPKIEQILRYGGSKDPQEVLEEVGFDMTSKKSWQGSFDIISGMQDHLESL